MGIAQQEANQLYPDEILSTSCMIADDKSVDRAIYIAGRTAEPCKEEVQAAADTLNTFFCTCGPLDSIPTHHELKHLAALVLDAARNAVM